MIPRFLPRLSALGLSVLLLLGAADALACGGRLHIEVRDAGVYALDFATITARQPGLADCRADELVLRNRGKEVPLRVVNAPGKGFGPDSRVEWLGQRLHGPQSWYDPYSTVNVYLLGAAPGAHARLHVLDARPGGNGGAALRRHLHLEQENLLLRLGRKEMTPGGEPDVWQWAKLTPIDAAPFAVDFDLPDLNRNARRTGGGVLALDLRGVSNVLPVKDRVKPPDHRVEVTLNGKRVAQYDWDGRDEIRRRLDVPAALLKSHGNRLQLRVPRRDLPGKAKNFIVDVVMFNWVEVGYPAHGDLNADGGAFMSTDAAPIAVRYRGTGTPALVGTDGGFRPLRALGAGRYLAAGAPADVRLYPFVEGHAMPPERVRAVADSDLRDADPGYDYVIVAYPTLLDAVRPLAQYHRRHGHRVALLDVDDVYDQFDHGIAHPRAIRNLMTWGMQHWSTKPRYLLLVGDASTDIHHDARNGRLSGASYLMTPDPPTAQILPGRGFGGMRSYSYPPAQRQVATRNLIPTWQFPTVEGQAASDNGFVTTKAGDFHPTLAVGRFPVVTPDEVGAIVAKTIHYLSTPAPGPWRRDVTLISTSEVASFKQASDTLARNLDRQGFATTNLYTDFNDRNREHYEQARKKLREDLDAGNLLVHFLGHGGSYIWRVGPMGDLFSLDDVSHLTNAGRYPMVLAMTCFSAPFDNPSDDSIGERFLREANRGAVAVFAASWKNSPNPAFSKILIHNLLTPGRSIGDAIVATKAKIQDRDFVEMYNLLGDPALVLARPDARLQLMRSADRWSPRVLVRVPGSDFGGDVYVDWTDAQGKPLASQHYQARNTLFALTPPDRAAAVSVYAADARNGLTAAGGLSLLAPKPAAAAKPAKAAVHAPVRPPPPVRRVAPTQPRGAHDRIALRDFERAADTARPGTPSTAAATAP